MMASAPVLLKIGGELLEDPGQLGPLVACLRDAVRPGPLVIVHGGGREIDAALKTAGIEKRQVDGLRITDEPTLRVVVSVLAGLVNTRLVAALNTAGLSAVGLTGADGNCGLSDVAPPHRCVDGRVVDLGRVGLPSDRADVTILQTLTVRGFVPVVASIGIAADGNLLNVNADSLAGHLASKLSARRLIIAGGTAGVLDSSGATVPLLDSEGIRKLVADGTATAGMVAKLGACRQALESGVEDVLIVSGRDLASLAAAISGGVPRQATRLVGRMEATLGKGPWP